MSVSSTYAEALYAAAKGAGRVDAVSADLASFVEALGTSSELASLLESPDVSAAAKKNAIATVVGQHNQTLANFLRLLIDRGRTADLPDINRAFALTGSSFGMLANFQNGLEYVQWSEYARRPSIWKVLWSNGWLGIRYVASAAIAWLLYVSFEQFGASVLLLAVPIIALYLSTLQTRIGNVNPTERQ